jgi:hypothetical protein
MFEYDTEYGMDFVQTHPFLPVWLVIAYLACCYYGTKYMSRRHAFDLRRPLAYWNLGLALFSLCGAIYTIPCLIESPSPTVFPTQAKILCLEPDFDGTCGIWVQLFIFSKIPELLDTFFIVARKRPLLFLHWYHHVTVLLFCWHSYANESSTGIYFVTMNYSVHAIMYGYYFLMAVEAKPFWLNPMFITFCQISQMIVGTVLSLVSCYMKLTEPECSITMSNILAGFVMYGSYLYLFCDFAIKKIEYKQRQRNKIHTI